MELELRGITKRFPGVLANDHIDLSVRPGTVHGLLGENGAGKTTLVNILYGLYRADEGEIAIDGRRVEFAGPADAIAAGIGMVHQHFMLVPVFTVAENVMLGVERTRGLGRLDRVRARRDVEEVARRYGLPVDADAVVEDLPVGIQQRVEIVKALLRDADVLILDEPTAVLTPQEVDELFDALRELRAAGKSIVFITHKLHEVREVGDTITVLRDGRVVGTAPPETPETELASMMVGRAVQLVVDRPPATPAAPVFEVRDLVVHGERGQLAVDDVSFDLRPGEILAIAGVEGNGQTELVRAITGLLPVVSGHVSLAGRELTGLRRSDFLEAGIGHIPEDRTRDALIAGFTCAENLFLDRYRGPPVARGLLLDQDRMRSLSAGIVREFDIRAPSVDVPIAHLSGGNQQKVVVAREIARDTAVLVASQPTRGVDVGSIEYIHRRLVQERDGGAAILIVSSELDEVMALGDRIAVMYRGRLTGPFEGGRLSREQIGLLMAGSTWDEVTAELGA